MEHNKYCVTVHFRNCEPQYWESVITTVEAFMQSRENLKATRGRKVLEIKPQVGAGFQGLDQECQHWRGRTASLWQFATRGTMHQCCARLSKLAAAALCCSPTLSAEAGLHKSAGCLLNQLRDSSCFPPCNGALPLHCAAACDPVLAMHLAL